MIELFRLRVAVWVGNMTVVIVYLLVYCATCSAMLLKTLTIGVNGPRMAMAIRLILGNLPTCLVTPVVSALTSRKVGLATTWIILASIVLQLIAVVRLLLVVVASALIVTLILIMNGRLTLRLKVRILRPFWVWTFRTSTALSTRFFVTWL